MRDTETPGSINGSVYPNREAFPLRNLDGHGVKALKDKARYSLISYVEEGGIRLW